MAKKHVRKMTNKIVNKTIKQGEAGNNRALSLFILAMLIIIALIMSYSSFNNKTSAPSTNLGVVPTPSGGVAYNFNCSNKKTIVATFYPNNDKQVDLVLSDGRRFYLPHVLSGSGARYANSDESVVFWNKGNTAFVTENGKTTFDGCIEE